MKIERLTAAHVLALRDLLPTGGLAPQIVSGAMARELASCGGWAAVDDDGPLAIGGVYRMHATSGHAWTWLTRRWRRHARAITEECARRLAECDCRRVEAAVLVGFEPGRRWLERLGFEMECERMRAWGADGRDYALFAKVRG